MIPATLPEGAVAYYVHTDFNASTGTAWFDDISLSGPKAVTSTEDIDGNRRIDAVDVQLVINAALGAVFEEEADIDGSGGVDAIDVQRVINAALGVPA